MKKLVFIIIALVSNLVAQVNGSKEIINNKTVVFLWGTHVERGYAHGYLVGDNIKDILDNYLIDYICYGNKGVYQTIRSIYTNYFETDQKYKDEAESMMAGIIASGVSLNNTVIGRNYDATDMLMMTALPDLSQLAGGSISFVAGCSSISSWGSSTEKDNQLNSNLVITRLMDWSSDPSLCNNHALIVNLPSETDEQAWISFGFTGLIGALSSINKSGIATFMNQGNITSHDYNKKFNPILLSIRNGIELADKNSDGVCNDQDIVSAVQEKVHGGASIIHTVMEKGTETHPFILEVNNKFGCVIRNTNDNTLVKGNNLAATNHFRKLYPPEECNRYNNIIDSLTHSTEISIMRSRKLLSDAAGVSWNLHAIQYTPSLDRVYWATATETAPAYKNEYSEFEVNTLLSHVTEVEDNKTIAGYNLYQNYPNPFNPQTKISFDVERHNYVTLAVYDIAGKLVKRLIDKFMPSGNYSMDFDGSYLASGVYLYKLSLGEKTTVVKKMLLMK